MYNRILIATDGSELSDKAVDSGLGLAALCGASVVVVQVVQTLSAQLLRGRRDRGPQADRAHRRPVDFPTRRPCWMPSMPRDRL